MARGSRGRGGRYWQVRESELLVSSEADEKSLHQSASSRRTDPGYYS